MVRCENVPTFRSSPFHGSAQLLKAATSNGNGFRVGYLSLKAYDPIRLGALLMPGQRMIRKPHEEKSITKNCATLSSRARHWGIHDPDPVQKMRSYRN